MKVSPAIKALAQEAIDVQNACNLSGVAHSLVKATATLWDEVHAGRGRGTDFVNRHPIIKMFVNKLYDLSNAEAFSQAYVECQDLANAEVDESLVVA